MVNFLLAIGLPVVLMAVGTRVMYSVIGALVVTFMVMIFAVQIHHMSGIAITLAIVSLLAGVRLAINLRKRRSG